MHTRENSLELGWLTIILVLVTCFKFQVQGQTDGVQKSYTKDLISTCEEGAIQCGNSEECVLKQSLCDGWPDCSNEWDESVENCPCDGFLCPNSTLCIPEYYVCDDTDDCPGREDEFDCPPCNGFTCVESGECIPGNFKCDWEEDCEDGSDEADCPPQRECNEDEFKCSSGRCIPDWWVCDGWADCANDEVGCSCDGFQCKTNGECLPSTWECNGVIDCADASDEGNCTCDEDEIDCGLCINPIWLCDYVVDCPDGSDEGTHCNYTMPRPTQRQPTLKLKNFRKRKILKLNNRTKFQKKTKHSYK